MRCSRQIAIGRQDTETCPREHRVVTTCIGAAIQVELEVPPAAASPSPAGAVEYAPPFLVVGAQRSGTTMLRLMLNRHPELFVPFESGFIPDFHARSARYGDLADHASASRLLDDIADHPLVRKGGLVGDRSAILARPHATYAELVRGIFEVEAARHGKRRWGDKTPSYVTDLDVMWTLFPGCRIVHLVRDGRDVAWSNRGVAWGIRNLPAVAADWRWKTTLGRKVGRVLGSAYLEVRYEDLVLDTTAVLGKLCAFLEVDYVPDMLDYPSDAAARMPADSLRWHQNSVRAPDPGLVYAWKHRLSSADRVIFEAIAGDALDLFGYERERRPASWKSRARSLYYATARRW